MKIYKIDYGKKSVYYSFHNDDTAKYMMPYVKETETTSPYIRSTHEYMDYLRPFYTENQSDSYIEYKSLIDLTSLELLKDKSVLFHAVAFKYKEKAWLFTGRSGAGKTTQYKNWKIILKDQVKLICGDMPCLSVENGEIIVYPSPWNGKERFKGKESAPLAGIILLEKRDYNEIKEISVDESLIPILYQIAVSPREEKDITAMSEIADVLLRKYPVMKLSNKADSDAVMKCCEYLERYL